MQELPKLLPVLLINTPDGAATVTFTAVYVPAVTVTLLVIKFVSVCRRVNSKSLDGFDENTETALPLEGVSVIPIIGNEKLTTLALLGGVSEIVKLREAFPPPPQFVVHGVFNPLQELAAKMAAMAKKKRLFVEFITYPRTGLNRPGHTDRTLQSPQQYSSAAEMGARRGQALRCPTVNCAPGQDHPRSPIKRLQRL